MHASSTAAVTAVSTGVVVAVDREVVDDEHLGVVGLVAVDAASCRHLGPARVVGDVDAVADVEVVDVDGVLVEAVGDRDRR